MQRILGRVEKMLIFFRKIKQRKLSAKKQGKAWEQMTEHAMDYIRDNTKGELWYHRLFDYQTFIAINPNLVCIKQPSDYMACYKGDFYLIENKSTTLDRFRLDMLKPHQEEAMELITQAGANYWLLILHRNAANPRESDAYALTPSDWKRVKKLTRKRGLVSAGWDDIAHCASHKLTRAHGVWDFMPLFAKADTLSAPGVSRIKMRKFTRSTKFIMASEFPAVALFDGETEEILIITDIWFIRNLELWRDRCKCNGRKCATIKSVCADYKPRGMCDKQCINADTCKGRKCITLTNVCPYRNTMCFEGVSDQLEKDLSQSMLHELEHWAVPDECAMYSGIKLTMFETCVDNIARDLAFYMRTKYAQMFNIKLDKHGEPVGLEREVV
jgi:penicillin-binding protein-related factor A (putative recombinase)